MAGKRKQKSTVTAKREQKRSKVGPQKHAEVERGRQISINDVLNSFMEDIPGFTKELTKKAKLQLITIYLKYAFWHVWKMKGVPILDHFSPYEIWLFSDDEQNTDMDSSLTIKNERILTAEKLLVDVDQKEQSNLNHVSELEQIKQKRKWQIDEKSVDVLCPIKRVKRPCIIYLKNADKSNNTNTIVSSMSLPSLLSSKKIFDSIENVNDASAKVNFLETNSNIFPYGQNDFDNGIYGTVPRSLNQCLSSSIISQHGYSSLKNINSKFAPISKTPTSGSSLVSCDHIDLFSCNLTSENIAEIDHQQIQRCSSKDVSGMDLLSDVSSISDSIHGPEVAMESDIYENTQNNVSAPEYQFPKSEQGLFPSDYNFDKRSVISANAFSESVQKSCFENIDLLNGIENKPINVPNNSLALSVTSPKGNKRNTHILSNIKIENASNDSERDCPSDFDFKVMCSNVMRAPKRQCSDFQQDPFSSDYNYNERSTNIFSRSAENICFQDMDILNGTNNLIRQNNNIINSDNMVFNATSIRNANKENTNILRNIKDVNTTNNSEKGCTSSDFDVIKSNNKPNYPSFHDENIANNFSLFEKGKRVVTKKETENEVKHSEGNKTMQNQNVISPFVSKKVEVYEKVGNKTQKRLDNSCQKILADSQIFENARKLKPYYTNDMNAKLSAKVNTTSFRITKMSPVQLKTKEHPYLSEFICDKENLTSFTNPGLRKTKNLNKNSSVFDMKPLKDSINIIIKPKIWEQEADIDDVTPKAIMNFKDTDTCTKVTNVGLQNNDSKEFISSDPNITTEAIREISDDQLLGNSQLVVPVNKWNLQDFQSCGHSPFSCVLGANSNCVQLKLDEKKCLGDYAIPSFDDMFDLLESKAKSEEFI